MKYLFFILVTGFLIACNGTDKAASLSQQKNDSLAEAAMKDSANYTTIEWIDSVHTDLGKITEGQEVEVSWHFKNTGNKPLIIQAVRPGCGCTIADKPMEPIAPGETSMIKAKFNSEGQHLGVVNKQVTVLANTRGGTSHILSFSADINK